MAQHPMDEYAFLRVLGGELRTARQQRGWVRRDLCDQLGRTLAIQTVSSYESGTRQITVTRFVEICVTLSVSPSGILQRTHDLFTGWTVDLTAAAKLTDPDLAPLAAWASSKLRTERHRRFVHLDWAAIVPLAALCGLDSPDLAHRLPSIIR